MVNREVSRQRPRPSGPVSRRVARRRNTRPTTDSSRPDTKTLFALYERMQLLRQFESAAQIACRKGETPGLLKNSARIFSFSRRFVPPRKPAWSSPRTMTDIEIVSA
jgi:hypothetical protein